MVDRHVHYSAIEEADSMLATAREAVPDGTITVTEFSPMWRHVDRLDERIDAFRGGGRFLARHGLPDGMTVVQYFKRAKRSPRPRRELATFMEVMPWYNVNFVTDTHDLLKQYDVDVATLGFLVGKGVRNTTWDAEWRPFQISFLFLRPLVATGDGAHPHYLPDYRKRT